MEALTHDRYLTPIVDAIDRLAQPTWIAWVQASGSVALAVGVAYLAWRVWIKRYVQDYLGEKGKLRAQLESIGKVREIVDEIRTRHDVLAHKLNLLTERSFETYVDLADALEEMRHGEGPPENLILNRMWARLLLTAPDPTVEAFLELTSKREGETGRRFDKEERNLLYLALRRTLNPETTITEDMVKDKDFNVRRLSS